MRIVMNVRSMWSKNDHMMNVRSMWSKNEHVMNVSASHISSSQGQNVDKMINPGPSCPIWVMVRILLDKCPNIRRNLPTFIMRELYFCCQFLQPGTAGSLDQFGDNPLY